MRIATVSSLRNRFAQLLTWLEAGEEILITRKGVSIARLVREPQTKRQGAVDWTQSPAFLRDRSQMGQIAAQEKLET